MKRTQRGVTLIGWIILLIPVAMVGYAGLRLFPVYLNYMKVSRGLQQLSEESHGNDSLAFLRQNLENRLNIEEVEFPEEKDFVIRRDGQAWVVEIDYEDGAPLWSNVSITAKFHKSVRIGAKADSE